MDEQREDIKHIYERLGEIRASLRNLEGQSSRTVWALLGIIAAQIGVKILGTPTLLHIATLFAIVGSVLLLGVLLQGWKIFRTGHKLTGTGKWFVVMVSFLFITQIAVYLMSLGIAITLDMLYAWRIFQNIAILGFAWSMMKDPRLICGKDKENK